MTETKKKCKKKKEGNKIRTLQSCHQFLETCIALADGTSRNNAHKKGKNEDEIFRDKKVYNFILSSALYSTTAKRFAKNKFVAEEIQRYRDSKTDKTAEADDDSTE